MPKPKNEDLISVNRVPALVLELTGITRETAVVYTWINKGRIGQHGENVKLKATKRLGNWYTTKQWLNEFLEAVG